MQSADFISLHEFEHKGTIERFVDEFERGFLFLTQKGRRYLVKKNLA